MTDIINGEKQIVRLDRTWFHAQGGGQKADHGKIGPANVVHAVHNGPAVDHHVDSAANLKVGEVYNVQVDQEWRKVNAVYHTAGHLIAGVMEAEFPTLKAVFGHQWPGEGRVEFEGGVAEIVPEHFILLAREKLALAINADLPVAVVGDPFTSRSRQIGDFAPIPCGVPTSNHSEKSNLSTSLEQERKAAVSVLVMKPLCMLMLGNNLR